MTSKPVNIRSVHTTEEFYSLKDAWNTLLAESPANSFFLRWEWLWAWWQAYASDNDRLCILLVFRENDLIGIAPFYLKKQTWKNISTVRRLMFLGTAGGTLISEFMDVICALEEQETVLRAIAQFISENDLCDDIFLHKIDASSQTSGILRQISEEMNLLFLVDNNCESPYLKLADNYQSFINGLSSSMRYKIKRNQKRLANYPDTNFRKTTSAAELEADFNELVRLHQLRWEARSLPGSFTGGKFPGFQKTVMKDMLKNGHLELWFLSVSGRNIAAIYNIRYKNKIYFYQAGLDVLFDASLTPGLLLHAHCIHEAIKDKLHEYDFLIKGNMDSYKKQWTKEYRNLCDIYIARSITAKLFTAARNTIGRLYMRYYPKMQLCFLV